MCLNSTGTCEINAWCPVEYSKRPPWEPFLFLQISGDLPFCATTLTLTLIPHRDADISQVLFITNAACQLHLFCALYTAACLFHFQRALTERSRELHHLHKEFRQVSQVWILQVSGCKWRWWLVCGWFSRHHDRVRRVSWEMYVFWWLLEIALGCRELSIYTSLCIALSETVKQSSETSLTAGLALDRCQIRWG